MPDEQRSGATRDGTDNANGTLAVYVWRGDGTGGGEQRFDVPRQDAGPAARMSSAWRAMASCISPRFATCR